jgi:tetratricopeptide (TPR) repeat protein
VLGIWSLGAAAHAGPKEPFEALFHTGAQAYKSGDFLGAAEAFNKSAALHPAAGTLQNLGNAEWQRGQPGTAIVAWERSAWLDPFNNAARDDLRFARKNAQVEAPELAWYEVVSTWLPSNWWAAIAGASFWGAVGMVMVPGILRIRKAGWHQAVAAFGVMVFLLSLPAHAGIYSRSRIGFVLEKNTPLRLTPTQDAQIVTHLGAAESVRCERQRGDYLLVHNARARGWIERDQCGLVCPK